MLFFYWMFFSLVTSLCARVRTYFVDGISPPCDSYVLG